MATAYKMPEQFDAAPVAAPMAARGLKIALYSGNYNYVRDGANQALNRLVAYLERQGCTVRVYSPTSDTPAFEPAGTLVSVPSLSIPGRDEYRLALGLPDRLKRDIRAFAPDIIHLSAPDPAAHALKRLGRDLKLPVVASIHTRFETYLEYYGFGFARPLLEAMLRRFYAGLDEVFVTTPGFGAMMRDSRIIANQPAVWSRGVDKARFNPQRRSPEWRWGLGIGDSEPVIGFVGRLVLEKGLETVAAAVAELQRRGVPHRLVVVGDGPARDRFQALAPDAIFTGFLDGLNLARAYASMDMLFNPSTTETFGNINLEAMASAIPVVAARASGNECLVTDSATGALVTPGDITGYADALQRYCTDPVLRTDHGQAGLAAAQAFDWDAINGAVLSRYRELIATKHP
ncbi:glycosyltransferase family 1 protein [Sandarakinorhabdus sp. AAP62]|uniref:glycosyltransferase family 4 protein n=1 Tax=Sandarakinorhabdus sp. AAP62 TaxID=1248916 RepID=UPI00031869B1|nr:glycosyltransferase family 1 protein [Sandarakinorhabdus sp. AAP62]